MKRDSAASGQGLIIVQSIILQLIFSIIRKVF